MIRIGISGWRYPPWRGTFFPRGLVQRDELHFASRQVNSIEINGTFYSLQRSSSFVRWRDATPDDFLFSVKGPRYLTHILRLKNPVVPLANFFASGVLQLGAKLGPLLWQLPPSLRFNAEALGDFFRLLPRTTGDATRLAKKQDRALRLPASFSRGLVDQPLRHALEVRHESFRTPAFIDVLRQHDIALVIADTAGKWPFLEDVTSDFVYVRLHGDAELYVSGYTDAALAAWARKIRAWSRGADAPGGKRIGSPVKRAARGRDVFVYFDNDVKVRAPYDAMSLAHRLKLGPKPAAAPPVHTISERPRTRWPGYGPRLRARKS
jgi:uncharacterized protein YecE (DUF72 family)